MKVLICVRRLDQGGAEMLECRLAVELQKMGVEAHIAAQYAANQFDGYNSRKKWMLNGIQSVYFLNSSGVLGPFKALGILMKIQALNRYDVILTNNSGLDSYVGLVKMVFSFKHVISFHTYLTDAVLNYTRIQLWQRLVKRAEAYYSISNFVRDNVNSRLSLDSSKNQTIYNAIECGSDSPGISGIRGELGINKDCRLILLAGRIESRKGFDIAIDYLSDVLGRPNVYLIVVGSSYEGNGLDVGLKGFHDVVSKKIQKLDLQSKVFMLGYRSDLFQIMRESSIFVHLARHEGFGLVLLEAICAGIPIVASNIGGIPEVLKDTPYRAYALSEKEQIEEDVTYWLNCSNEELVKATTAAKGVLRRYTHERRAMEIKSLFLRLFGTRG